MKREGCKRIRLNRETLRTLDGRELEAAAGGFTYTCTKTPTACAPASGCLSCEVCGTVHPITCNC